MTDARLREAERQWFKTGTSQDELAYMHERVRAGVLPQSRLELLCRMGHFGPAVGTEPSLLAGMRRPLAEAIVWCTEHVHVLRPREGPLAYTPSPDPLVVDDIATPAAVGQALATRRQLLLETGWIDRPRAGNLAGGRLLVYLPDRNLACGTAAHVSDGLLDDCNCPPLGSWVGMLNSMYEPGDRCLLAWIPASLVARADAGVRVNPEECIRWADEETDSSLSGLLKAAGLRWVGS